MDNIFDEEKKKPAEFQRRELDHMHVGVTPGRIQEDVEVKLEIAQRVRDDGSPGRPTLAVVLQVGSRFLRLDAESWRSLAQQVGEAILQLAEDREHKEEFETFLDQWKKENPWPPKELRRSDGPGDGSPNRGLRATGKTARKRSRRVTAQGRGPNHDVKTQA